MSALVHSTPISNTPSSTKSREEPSASALSCEYEYSLSPEVVAPLTSVTPFLKLATVSHNGTAHKTFACDEGPNLGGLGSAPTPLMYFSAALAF